MAARFPTARARNFWRGRGAPLRRPISFPGYAILTVAADLARLAGFWAGAWGLFPGAAGGVGAFWRPASVRGPAWRVWRMGGRPIAFVGARYHCQKGSLVIGLT